MFCNSNRMTSVDLTFQQHEKMNPAVQYDIISPFMVTS